METMTAIAQRKSVRSYQDMQISEDALNAILTAGCAAPVASGMYDSLHLTVVQDKGLLLKMADIITEFLKPMGRTNTTLYSAPTLILVSSKEAQAPGIEHANAGCVLENMALAATDLGIASVVMGAPVIAVKMDVDVCEALAIPDGFNAVLGIALGYATNPDEPAKEHKITIDRI